MILHDAVFSFKIYLFLIITTPWCHMPASLLPDQKQMHVMLRYVQLRPVHATHSRTVALRNVFMDMLMAASAMTLTRRPYWISA